MPINRLSSLALSLGCTVLSVTAQADSTYFDLAAGAFSQDWSNAALITTDDNLLPVFGV